MPQLVFEHQAGAPLEPGQVDGMATIIEDGTDVLSTDWDVAFENPPHAHLKKLDLVGDGQGEGS